MNRLRTLLASPLAWGLIALVLLLANLAPWVYPGAATALLADALGVWPTGADPSHPLARLVFGAVGAALPAGGGVAGLNACSAIVGALCAALLCALVRGLFRLLADEPRTAPHTPWAEALAVASAAVALLLSPPFLRAATHFQWQPFDLLLALSAGVLILRAAAAGGGGRLAAAAFAVGLTAPEAPELLLLAPVLLTALGVAHWAASERVDALRFPVRLLLPAALGAALTFLAAGALAVGGGAPSLLGAAKAHLLGLLLAVGAFFNGPWILFTFFGLLPGALAPFVIRAVGANLRSLPVLGTTATLGALGVLAFLPLGVAPGTLSEAWGEAYPVLVSAAVALGVGAAVGAAWLLITVRQPAEGAQEGGRLRPLGRGLGWALLPAMGVAAAVFGGWGAVRALAADRALSGLPKAYADAVLDRAAGTWLLGDGATDRLLALRLAERGEADGITLLARDDTARVLEAFDASPFFAGLPEARREAMRLTLRDLGLDAFLRDWLAGDPAALGRFATLLLPAGGPEGFRPVPEGLLYRCVADRKVQHSALRAPRGVSECLPQADAEAGEAAAPALRAFSRYVRGRLGAVANNTAFYLLDAGREDEALPLFRAVYAYDPDNVSALFNIVELVQRGHAPELRDWCRAEVDGVISRLNGARYRLDAILVRYGYVRSPQLLGAFVSRLAEAGLSAQALAGMARMGELFGDAQGPAFQGALAALAAMDPARRAEARERYAALVRETADPAVKQGYARELVRLAILDRDFEAAHAWLAQGEALGDPADLGYERALLHVAEGDPGAARAALRRCLAKTPRAIDANAMLATLQLQAGELEELRAKTLPLLVSAAGTEENYFVQVIRAQLAEREGDLAAARSGYLRALALRPEVDALRNTILALDIRLGDRVSANTHARDFLKRDREMPLANYVMGALALNEGRLDDALAYLSRATAPTARPQLPEAFNDLAETHRRRGEWEAALAAARRACAIDPDLAVAHETAAAALLGLGRHAEAHQALDQAVAVERRLRPDQPGDPRFALTRARLHAAEGHDDLARAALAEARRQYDALDPGAKAEFDALDAQLRR